MQSHVAIATGHAAVNKRLEFYAVPFSVSLSPSFSLMQEAASEAAG